jgi:hypothetical protein
VNGMTVMCEEPGDGLVASPILSLIPGIALNGVLSLFLVGCSRKDHHTKDIQLGSFQEVKQFFQKNLLISIFWTMRLTCLETSIIWPTITQTESFWFKCQLMRIT